MGAIRKTLSVTTLGIIPFRSRKEKLHRAETAAQLADLEVRKEHEARLDADRRVSVAERRAREAEEQVVKVTRKAERRRDGRQWTGGRRARAAARRASKEAKRAAKAAKVEGAKVVVDVRDRAHELTHR